MESFLFGDDHCLSMTKLPLLTIELNWRAYQIHASNSQRLQVGDLKLKI